jgi:hypothetical protein
LIGSFMVGNSLQAQAGPVECSPSTTTVALGASVTLSASGGDGSFIWSSPGLVITNPVGEDFTVNFSAPGTHAVTVTSDGEADTCTVIVTAVEVPGGPAAPGLPDTGYLPE